MNSKHGHGCADKRSQEYQAWANMKARCQNSNNSTYHNYGERGIRVCRRWQDFRNFIADMGEKPLPELTLERMNNDGDYEPGNCKWATRKEQNNNKRVYLNQYWFMGISPNGEKFVSSNQHTFAKRYNLNQSGIANCLNGKSKTHRKWRFIKI